MIQILFYSIKTKQCFFIKKEANGFTFPACSWIFYGYLVFPFLFEYIACSEILCVSSFLAFVGANILASKSRIVAESLSRNLVLPIIPSHQALKPWAIFFYLHCNPLSLCFHCFFHWWNLIAFFLWISCY